MPFTAFPSNCINLRINGRILQGQTYLHIGSIADDKSQVIDPIREIKRTS